MKKVISTYGITLILFLSMTSIVLAAGYYKNSLNERASFRAELNGENSQLVVYDMNNQGLAKKIFQQGKIYITSGHRGGVKNVGDDPVLFRVKANDFPSKVHFHSGQKIFDDKLGKVNQALGRNQQIDLSIETEIPRTTRNQYDIFSGSIQFVDIKTNEVIGEVPVKVINSKYQPSNADSDIDGGVN